MFFKQEIYQQYIDENLEVTNNRKHKILRVQIIDDFCEWKRKNNYIENQPIYAKTQLSQTFKNEVIKTITKITKIDFNPRLSKNNHKGGFTGLRHKHFQ